MNIRPLKGSLIVDFTKVARLAIQNTASVASLLVTAQAVVIQKRGKRGTPPMPRGRGMY